MVLSSPHTWNSLPAAVISASSPNDLNYDAFKHIHLVSRLPIIDVNRSLEICCVNNAFHLHRSSWPRVTRTTFSSMRVVHGLHCSHLLPLIESTTKYSFVKYYISGPHRVHGVCAFIIIIIITTSTLLCCVTISTLEFVHAQTHTVFGLRDMNSH